VSPDPRAPRRGIAQVVYAPAGRFQKIAFAAGETKTFGSDDRAQIVIADRDLRGAHFAAHFDGVGFHVRLLGDAFAGVDFTVDGAPRPSGFVEPGGIVTAARTTVRFTLERATAPDPSRVAPLPVDVLEALGPLRAAGELYAIADAARDPRVLALLEEAIDPHASLHEGARGAALDDSAPHLVKLLADSRLLERLLEEGWGRSWFVLARSALPAKEVRRHLRRFLMVVNDTTEERLYFRFYDPRVLREFMAVATPRQRSTLLHGFGAFLCESEGGSLSIFEEEG
jgi:hypothetical protein